MTNTTVEILTTKGEVILVDEVDLPLVSGSTWFIDKDGYAIARRNKKNIKMHKILCPDWPRVDHKNHNGADNRRANLRPATVQQNSANSRKRGGCSSKFKGVFWRKYSQRWIARIGGPSNRIYLGSFAKEEDAAEAYRKAALIAWGEYACTGI